MKIIAQLVKFGLVGLLATIVHGLIALTLIRFNFSPLIANPIGFLVAFQVSYFGHSRWSFRSNTPRRLSHQGKFFFVSISGLLCSQGLLYGLLKLTVLSESVSLIIALGISAGFTFLLSRQWAFRDSDLEGKVS